MSDMRSLHEILTRELPRLRARLVRAGGDTPKDHFGQPTDRRLCPDCLGRGYQGCRRCAGTGLVCPYCQGWRMFRQEDEENPRLLLPQRPCPHCTDWESRPPQERFGPMGRVEFRVDREREARAILEWTERYDAAGGMP